MTCSSDGHLVDRVAEEMRLYFKEDSRRINHAQRVAKYAERLLDSEKGEPLVVLSAAYLHDIGIHEAERKYSSTAARYQHKEGPPIAREVLNKLEAPANLIEAVCDIIGHHHNPRPQETVNFKVVYDADLIVNLEDMRNENTLSPGTVTRLVARRFLTESGQDLGKKLFVPASC